MSDSMDKNNPGKDGKLKRLADNINEAISDATAEALKREQIKKRKAISAKRKKNKINEENAKKEVKKKSTSKKSGEIFGNLIKDVASKLTDPNAIKTERVTKKKVTSKRKLKPKKKPSTTTTGTSKYVNHLPQDESSKNISFENLEKKEVSGIRSYEDLQDPDLREEWQYDVLRQSRNPEA